jgi:hypothetical protein
MDQPRQPHDGSGDSGPLPPPLHESADTEVEKNWGRIQGAAYQAAFDDAAQSALASGGAKAGDFLIRFLIRNATGMYYLEDGQLTWEEPTDSRLHVEIAVCDVHDYRFIPGLEVYGTLFDAAHNELGEHRHTLLWHPTIFHYGRNWNAPADDTFTLRVRVEMPDFPRHDKFAGLRYFNPAEVEFKRIRLRPPT